MVTTHIEARGVHNRHVLRAMRDVPREAFVEPGFEVSAYADTPLPIGEGQTISQPYIVAFMIEASELAPGERALEVGAGSGYAAAVMSRIAQRVHAIERHAVLADRARERLAQIGYGNVEIRTGDGTRGWPEAAPFDVILVAAGGPDVPRSLREQLAVGGRMVIPVGDATTYQTLLRVRRTGKDTWEEEHLAAVRFVPLVGEEGWTEDGRRAVSSPAPGNTRARRLPELIADAAEPLPDFDDPAFGRLFDRFANARVVLLGEASHGTAEFYRARAAITRRLIEAHGFTIVAVEADWPDAAAVDRHVRHRAHRAGIERAFQRFPTWMWRNTEIDALIGWMRAHNADIEDMNARVGFHGLDIYNMSASIEAVLAYLDAVDPQAAELARERYGCLAPWQNDPATYGRAVLSESYGKCEDRVVAQCRELLARRLDYTAQDGENFLDAAQNARLIASAERYYRIMYHGGSEAWNLRDMHMFETLENLLDARGPDAKAIVWAHNSHIGDARFTAMGRRGELNIGQLCRERFGSKAALIGFGTNAGTVAAANDWGGDMEVKQLRPARPDSYERLCHEAAIARFLLDLRTGRHEALRRGLLTPRLERFIGVIYRPETELQSHYAEAVLPRQFDAWMWFDETTALTPLGPQHVRPEEPETYPFGL